VVAVGLLLIAAYSALISILMSRSTFDTWGPALLVPTLIALTVPALRRQADREGDPTLFRLLVFALIVKLAGAILRYYVTVGFYGGLADANGYHQAGASLAEQIRQLDFSGVEVVVGTRFLDTVTGAIYAVIGATRLGGFVFFSWLGFWGLFLFYRAFVAAVPEGRPRSYAHLVLFLPSLVFWPSSIGKEAWMTFTLGLAAYGVAKVLAGEPRRALAPGLLGIWLAGMLRPHMAALTAVAFAFAVVARRSKRTSFELAPVAKVASVLVVAALAFLLVNRSERFLEDVGVEPNAGVSSTLRFVQDRTSTGGSAFSSSVVDSPAQAPLAALTVLFRPTIFEAHNTQALLAAMESAVLALVCLLRVRWAFAALRSVRRSPYVSFCLAYSALFIIAFSSFSNFGLLARQRVQLFPLFLVLFAIPPRPRTGEREADPARSTTAR
jgi:hypothetical protein